jgi:hypothetical protein
MIFIPYHTSCLSRVNPPRRASHLLERGVVAHVIGVVEHVIDTPALEVPAAVAVRRAEQLAGKTTNHHNTHTNKDKEQTRRRRAHKEDNDGSCESEDACTTSHRPDALLSQLHTDPKPGV